MEWIVGGEEVEEALVLCILNFGVAVCVTAECLRGPGG